jgi:hypothetical protein
MQDGHRHKVACELRDGEGRSRYRATVDLAPPGEAPVAAPFTQAGAGRTWPYDSTAIYRDRVLFHGPAFAVIHSLLDLSDRGGSALLEGVLGKSWPGGPWRADAAMIDGGMQLAILWAHERTGQASLPTALDALVVHVAAPVKGTVRCSLHTQLVGSQKTVSDLRFTALDGRLLAELRGLEMHLIAPATDPIVKGH